MKFKTCGKKHIVLRVYKVFKHRKKKVQLNMFFKETEIKIN